MAQPEGRATTDGPPIRVMIVVGSLDLGGAEGHLLRVLPALRRWGVEPKVYTLTHRGLLAPKMEAAGVEVVEPPLARYLRRLPKLLRPAVSLPIVAGFLWWVMVIRRPAIVHFFLPAAYIIGGICSLLAGRPVRIMSRRSLNDYQRRHPLLARLERRLHRHMSAVLGNSHAVVSQLGDEGVPRDRLGLLYNGVEEAPAGAATRRQMLRHDLGIDESALVMVVVANFLRYKGHLDLVDALQCIRDDLPAGWTLLLVGADYGAGEEVRARAQAAGIIGHLQWLGRRTDVPDILAASDIALSCSHQEGFSNSVLEAMAAGLPLVVTDVGGNPEAVEHRRSGIVVPPQDPHSLGEALATLVRDPELRRRMGSEARQRIDSTFSLDLCVQHYAQLYSRLHRREEGAVARMVADA